MSQGYFTFPVALLVCLSFLLGTSEFLVVGILPEIADGFQISITEAGSVISVFALVYACGTPFFAAFAGKYNRYKCVMVCTAIFMLSVLVSAISTSYTLFLISRIVTAIFSGTLVSVAMMYAKDISSPKHTSKVIAWIFTGFSIAAIFGVPLATTICSWFNWRASFIFVVIASIVVLLLMYKIMPPGSHSKTDNVLKQFRLFLNVKILLGVAIVLFGAAGMYTFYTYLTPILEEEMHLSGNYISLSLLLYGLAALVSNILSAKIADHGGMRRMPTVYWGQCILLLLLTFASQSFILGAIVLFILGISMYLINAPSQLFFLHTAEQDNPACESLASSLSPVFFNFGIALGAVAGGGIVEYTDLRYVGIGGAFFAVLAGLCCIILIKVMKAASSKDSQYSSLKYNPKQ